MSKKLTEEEKILKEEERARKKAEKESSKNNKGIVCKKCEAEIVFYQKGDPCFSCGYETPNKKPPPEKKEKVEKSEGELVHSYVKRVMDGKKSRGHIDERFAETKADGTVNKEMWRDQDFFFSFLFESAAQKYQFIEQFEKLFALEFDEEYGHQIQIVNGYELGKRMGFTMTKEESLPYPGADLELKPLVLDNEAL